jgi:GNAT superfamily N-acetyltransferase
MLRVRDAVAGDAPEVVRLARLMFESMGLDAADPRWQRDGEQQVRDRLGSDLAIYVVDHPTEGGRLVCSAAGIIARRLPTPGNPAATAGYVQWVATEPAFRRQGLARAVMTALLDWYRRREVALVELHATADGEPLYRSLGFSEGPGPALRRMG